MKLAIWGHLWTDAAREGGPENVIARCKRAGIDTYLAYVYPMEKCFLGEAPGFAYNTTAFQGGKNDLLTPLLRAAKAEGVEVEPWLLPFRQHLLTGENEAEVCSRAYQPLGWEDTTDPSAYMIGGGRAGTRPCATWPENRARGIVMLRDYIENHGADLAGIDMDYIRYGDVDMCWKDPCHCDACRKHYADLFGKDTITAEELELPGVRYQFIHFRNRCIRELVEEIRDITLKAGLRLTMSARAQVFDYAIAEGQNWPQWARDGLIDAVFVMNYSTDRTEHRQRVETHVSLLRDRGGVLHCDGVGKMSSAGENTTDNLVAYARDALAAGADGISIFHYNGMADADFEAIGALKS